jgi:hypothetical protein
MDYKRYNISQLSRLTNTHRLLLYEWIRKGYLIPSHYAGQRPKYTYEAYCKAEKLALEEYKNKIIQKQDNIIPAGVYINPDIYNNLELYY